MAGWETAKGYQLKVSRRTLLTAPLAAGGLLAMFRWPQRGLPDVRANGGGPLVSLVIFAGNGLPDGVVAVHKIVKSREEWRRELSSDEFAVTRLKGTESAFSNKYWNAHGKGVYCCVCCGNAVFRSQDKFDSGTGWPSFTAPAAKQNIYTQPDSSLAELRTEVLCRKCDAHLGHVFDDGPAPTGLRYCMNSIAMRLI